ncbi:MAG: CAP domain-containing protein [Sphingomonas sp.]|nr:CAP domain-containing protein [Sphingomonas sp.]
MWGQFATIMLLAAAPASAGDAPGLDDDVLTELNWVRAHPREYAEELRDYRDRFDGHIVYSDEAPDGVMTKEGAAAVDDAIAFLERQAPLQPLAASQVLAGGADDLVADQRASGHIGHYTMAGLNPGARVKRHGGDIYVGEVIAYGQPNPRSIVRQFIVDDGIARRGHRFLIFSGMYNFAGTRCGPHPYYGAMCVIDLAATPDGTPKLPANADGVTRLSSN